MATSGPGTTLDTHLLADRFRPRPQVLWVAQADATVLLDADRGLYYTLNEVAARAWELLVAGEPLIEVLRALEDEYEVTRETLEADLAALLCQWRGAALIERLVP